MAKEAKILSFDEARRTTSVSRPSISASKKALKSAKPSKRQVPKNGKGKSAAFPVSQALFASRTSHTMGKSSSARKQNASSTPRTSQAARASQAVQSRKVTRVPQATKKTQEAQAAQAAGKLKPISSKSRRPSVSKANSRPFRVDGKGRKANGSQGAQALTSESEEKRESRLTRFRRKRTKAKADRTFGKQYGDIDKPSEASQTSPRAAVYKGEMGSTQRRAARMQGRAAGLAMDSSAKRTVKGRGVMSRLIAGAAVVVCIVLTCAFLYPTAQQYYVNVRECDRLQAEYDAVIQRNAVIQSEVNSLSTDAGIEDRAREEFGWVKVGEQAVNVYGVDETGSESLFSANIVTGSVEAPETWYSTWLDPLFGVE